MVDERNNDNKTHACFTHQHFNPATLHVCKQQIAIYATLGLNCSIVVSMIIRLDVHVPATITADVTTLHVSIYQITNSLMQ